MKKLKLITTSTLIVSILVFGACMSSCKKENNTNNQPATNTNNTAPDASFNAIITGDMSNSIDFTLPGGVADTRSINGSLISSAKLLQIIVLNGSASTITLVASGEALTTGSFPMNTGNGAISSYTDGSNTFQSTSGTIKINNVQEHSSGMGGYISGEVNMSMEEKSSSATRTISVSGTFSGVYIGKS